MSRELTEKAYIITFRNSTDGRRNAGDAHPHAAQSHGELRLLLGRAG